MSQEQLENQRRWDQYGSDWSKDIENNPEQHLISECPSPLAHKAGYGRLKRILSPMRGKKMLELGCGPGNFSVWLAKQGADVSAIDIGPEIVKAANRLAKINCANCEFSQGDMKSLDFDNSTYDAVIGLMVLHHLSEANVVKTLQECHRILRPGGVAVFYEPVENSKSFNLIQNLIPVGKKGSHKYRPSILQRRAWAEYVQTLDDRTMTSREFILGGEGLFQETCISPYGFLVRLRKLLGFRSLSILISLDKILFRLLPPLRHFCQTVLVEYKKGEDLS